jgi:hypothetical protein
VSADAPFDGDAAVPIDGPGDEDSVSEPNTSGTSAAQDAGTENRQ